MNRNRSLLFACLALLFLNSCQKKDWNIPYRSIGKFANRTTAEALTILVKRFASLPQSQYYKFKYPFDDPQLPPELSSTHEHAIW